VELLRPHREKAKKKKIQNEKRNKKVEVKGRKRQTQNQNQMNTRSGTRSNLLVKTHKQPVSSVNLIQKSEAKSNHFSLVEPRKKKKACNCW
jgi:hypothetical protein